MRSLRVVVVVGLGARKHDMSVSRNMLSKMRLPHMAGTEVAGPG